jgi:flagellar assembly protein FliH
MSRVLRSDSANEAASLGSFVLKRGKAGFRARAAGAPAPGNEFEPAPFTAEQESLQAEAQAYAQGYEEGRRVAEEELAGEREAVARLAASLELLRPQPTNPLALLLAETVDRLVREIVGSVEVDATLLLDRARSAAAMIGEQTEPARLRVHPADAALLVQADLDVQIAPDGNLQRGTIVVETAQGWIEDGPAVRLERLRAELDKMAAAR